MFKELSPLLAKRSLILTITAIDDNRLRGTITPRLKSKDEPASLAQPFAVEGTAEELDAELPQAIIGYASSHMTLERYS